MTKLNLRSLLCLFLMLLLVAFLVGCGGGGSISGGTDTPQTATAPYSALFHVEVASGEVTTVSPLSTTQNSKAILTGTAVAFESSRLVDEGGSAGVRSLAVKVKNQTRRSLTNAHLLFSNFTNVGDWSDPRPLVQVSTLAGLGVSGYVDGSAGRLNQPSGVAVDDAGNLYLADYGNHCIRKLSGGVLSTLAGNGTAGSTNGLGTAARFKQPVGLAWCARDRALYVAEVGGNRIRRIDSTGYVTTVAGTGTAGSANGTGAVATFNQPAGLTTDGTKIYIAEFGGNRVRKLVYSGSNQRDPASYTVSTVAGNGTAATVDGVGTGAQLNRPYGLTCDAEGILYVAEMAGRRIRRIETGAGATVTIAGTGSGGSSDGTGSVATLQSPSGIVALPNRGQGPALIVADNVKHTLRQLRLTNGSAPSSAGSWLVQTLAGQSATSGNVDGTGEAARFNAPMLLGCDTAGNVLVSDRDNHKLRQVRPNGGSFPLGVATGSATTEPVVLANAAGVSPWSGGDPRPWLNCPDLAGGAISEPVEWTFAIPDGVTAFEFTVTLEAATDPYAPVESAGGSGSSRVLVRTLAGSTSGANGFVDGVGANARFSCIIGMATDAQGVLYVCDAENNTVRRIEPGGRVTTVAGVVGAGAGSADGRGNTATFSYPTSVAVVPPNLFSQDGALPAGTQPICLLVADLDSDRIRLIRGPYTGWTADRPWEPWNPSFYQVATIAGGAASEYVNGRGDTARFSAPGSIAAGPGGIFYVCERTGGNRIRTLQYTGGDPMSATNWQVRLLAGSVPGSSGYLDGQGQAAQFNDPRGITVGPTGDVFVADTYNNCVRKITPDGVVTTLAGTISGDYADATGAAARFNHPWDIACGPDGYLYVPDRYNYRVRRISPTGVVSTVCGTGSSGRVDGLGNQSRHEDDLGIAVNSTGDLYLAEAECVRLIQRLVDTGDVVASN